MFIIFVQYVEENIYVAKMYRLRRFISFAIFSIFLLASFDQAEAQLNRRKIKKNNRRMSSFKGRKNTFTQEKRYSSIGLTTNAMNYFGDLTPISHRFSTDLKLTRPAFGLTYGYRFGPYYTIRGQFSYGTLRGSDYESADPIHEVAKFRYVRNLSFRNRIKELSVTGMFDLFKNENTYISRVDFTPYAFGGVAIFHHNPKALAPATDQSGAALAEAGQWVDLQPLGTEGQFSTLSDSAVNFGIKPYNKFQISIPLGIGVRYRISDTFDFSMETGFRVLFTDYIDDVGANYVDLNVLGGPLARAMADRSQETIDAESGEARNMEAVASVAGVPFPSPGGYNTFAGYGRESPTNMRGSKNADIYFVTTIRFSYIIGASFKKAKFR